MVALLAKENEAQALLSHVNFVASPLLRFFDIIHLTVHRLGVLRRRQLKSSVFQMNTIVDLLTALFYYFAEACNSQIVADLGIQVRERKKYLRCCRSRVDENVKNTRTTIRIIHVDLIVRCVPIQAVPRRLVECFQSLQIFSRCVWWMHDEAAPDVALLERSQDELCNDTKIITSASQRLEEICMLLSTGNHYATAGDYDLARSAGCKISTDTVKLTS